MIDAQRLSDSPAEEAARCPHFGACGGCQLQHLHYETQLARKREALQELFTAAGVSGLPGIEAHSAEPWSYRNRIRLRVERVEGELRVGYSRHGSNVFLPIVVCPIAAEPLWRFAEAIVEQAATSADAAALLETCAEVELFANDDLSRVQVTFFARGRQTKPPARFDAFVVALQERVDTRLAGAAVVYADPQSGRIVRSLAEHGAAGLSYRVGDESYWISRGGFFQVNRFLLERLVELVTRDGGMPRTGALAWDLFAGVGLFTRVLARSFARVTAVEANPVAVADLSGVLAKSSPASKAVAATTLDFLRRAVLDRDRPELVVLDPPRAGAGPEACRILLQLAPREIVYVSCDPSTLARDLAVLREQYQVRSLHMVDLFPQTAHVETVAILTRSR